jgi:hypothetical protein
MLIQIYISDRILNLAHPVFGALRYAITHPAFISRSELIRLYNLSDLQQKQ